MATHKIHDQTFLMQFKNHSLSTWDTNTLSISHNGICDNMSEFNTCSSWVLTAVNEAPVSINVGVKNLPNCVKTVLSLVIGMETVAGDCVTVQNSQMGIMVVFSSGPPRSVTLPRTGAQCFAYTGWGCLNWWHRGFFSTLEVWPHRPNTRGHHFLMAFTFSVGR